MTETTYESVDAQALVKRLLEEAEMSPDTISDALDKRVSSRTIYRWAKGESAPQQKSDLDALVELVNTRCSARGGSPSCT